VLATVGQAMPGFWLGLLLIFVFAIKPPWFPADGNVSPSIDPRRSPGRPDPA
jgi:peptide/nickel transport system permease protein